MMLETKEGVFLYLYKTEGRGETSSFRGPRQRGATRFSGGSKPRSRGRAKKEGRGGGLKLFARQTYETWLCGVWCVGAAEKGGWGRCGRGVFFVGGGEVSFCVSSRSNQAPPACLHCNGFLSVGNLPWLFDRGVGGEGGAAAGPHARGGGGGGKVGGGGMVNKEVGPHKPEWRKGVGGVNGAVRGGGEGGGGVKKRVYEKKKDRATAVGGRERAGATRPKAHTHTTQLGTKSSVPCTRAGATHTQKRVGRQGAGATQSPAAHRGDHFPPLTFACCVGARRHAGGRKGCSIYTTATKNLTAQQNEG